jgi:chromosome segregation ATPase
MADNKRTYEFEIKGVKESYNNLVTLRDILTDIDSLLKTNSIQIPQNFTGDVSKAKQATDELGKSIEKNTQFNEENFSAIQKVKSELKAKQDAVKASLKDEQALNIINEKNVDTYNDISKYVSALNRVRKDLNLTSEDEVKQYNELTAEASKYNEMLKAMDKEMGNHQREVGNYAIAGKSLKAELRDLKTQMAEMLAAGATPMDKSFQALAERAGELQDALTDAGAEVQRFANDSQVIQDVVDMSTMAASSFGLVQSTMSAFGIENENVARSIEKLEAAQTALASIQQLGKLLTDNSTIAYRGYHKMLQLVGLEKKKVAAATTVETATQEIETTVTGKATIATKLFGAAMKTLPILLIVSAIGLLITNFENIYNWFKKLLAPIFQVGGAFDKLKAVFIAIGETITDYILLPFKT